MVRHTGCPVCIPSLAGLTRDVPPFGTVVLKSGRTLKGNENILPWGILVSEVGPGSLQKSPWRAAAPLAMHPFFSGVRRLTCMASTKDRLKRQRQCIADLAFAAFPAIKKKESARKKSITRRCSHVGRSYVDTRQQRSILRHIRARIG